jgi:sugar phosphate permease
MNGIGGKAGWSWIFILEGILTCIVAIASFWVVCDFPEDCRFLTEGERAMLLARIKVDTANTNMDHLSWETFFWIMRDWKIYCSGFMYLTCVTTSYSIALFLPTILKSMVADLLLR